MSPLLLGAVVVLATAMAYMNGFHDASNAVSTTITTRTLRESTALRLAALLNLLGALLGMTLLSVTVPWAVHLVGLEQLVAETAQAPELLGLALLAIMATTILWDLLTWWVGMPSSTWHAFFGATLGTSLAIGAAAAWDRLGMLLAISVIGPLLAAAIAYLLMQGVLYLGRHERLQRGHLRFAQTVSAGAVAAGHGLSDSRLPLAVVIVAEATTSGEGPSVLTMMLMVSVAVAAGTLQGGHRIIRTLGRRLTDLSVAQGLAAETSAAAMMSLGVFGLESPVSTSHSLAASVTGAGAARGMRTVRWPVAGTILATWVLTPLASAVLGAAVTGVALESVGA